MVMGLPAKIKRAVSPEETERFRQNAQNYVHNTQIYREEENK